MIIWTDVPSSKVDKKATLEGVFIRKGNNDIDVEYTLSMFKATFLLLLMTTVLLKSIYL